MLQLVQGSGMRGTSPNCEHLAFRQATSLIMGSNRDRSKNCRMVVSGDLDFGWLATGEEIPLEICLLIRQKGKTPFEPGSPEDEMASESEVLATTL